MATHESQDHSRHDGRDPHGGSSGPGANGADAERLRVVQYSTPLHELPGELKEAEAEYIAQRRAAAQTSADAPTVGLALSGGGIRSASFNLGFVQALAVNQMLRHVDYLSTVSGGGYVGGFLAAGSVRPGMVEAGNQTRATGDVTKPGEPADNAEPIETTQQVDAEDQVNEHAWFVPEPTGRQPAAVRRLLKSGRYLKRVPRFVNRYLFGLLMLNAWLFCGLAAFGAASALVFHFINARVGIHAAHAIGFAGDIRRAFLPAVACALIWLLLWGVRNVYQLSRRIHDTPKLDFITRTLALLMLVLLVMGFVSLLVTGDINLPFSSSAVEKMQPFLPTITQVLTVVLVIFQLLALLPMFRLEKLVQSGARPRSLGDTLIFNIAGPALVFGLPLMAFGWFAREDVSGRVTNARVEDFGGERRLFEAVELWEFPFDAQFDERNPALLSLAHFTNWPDFWNSVRQRAVAAEPEIGNPAWNGPGYETVETRLLVAAGPALSASLDVSAEYRDALAGSPLVPWPWDRLGQVRRMFELRKQRDETQQQVTRAINEHCLSDADFYLAFESAAARPEFYSPVDPDRVGALLPRAKGLALSAGNDADLAGQPRLLQSVRQVNRDLLQAYFGDSLLPPGTVFSYTTWHSDQNYRAVAFGIFLALWLLLGLCDANVASLHQFYRERLRDMWIGSHGAPEDRMKPVQLSELRQPEREPKRSFPYFIVNATAHISGRADLAQAARRTRLKPQQTRFEFTPLYCGFSPIASDNSVHHFYESTAAYERHARVDLAGVMAISGSAVSPAMTDSFILRVLLFVANARLGQWLKRPALADRVLALPGLVFCVCSIMYRQSRRFLFLSDGGHYDNLGVEALLERRVKRIICVDAGHDPNGRFTDLLKLVRRNRAFRGIRFSRSPFRAGELASRYLERLKGEKAESHFLTAEILYPDGSSGELIYVKPSFTMDEPAELISYRDENPDFPHDPTLDQFYDERRFESYRALGWHIAVRLMAEFLDRSSATSAAAAGIEELSQEQSIEAILNLSNDLQSDRRQMGPVLSQVQLLAMQFKSEQKSDGDTSLFANAVRAIEQLVDVCLKHADTEQRADIAQLSQVIGQFPQPPDGDTKEGLRRSHERIERWLRENSA